MLWEEIMEQTSNLGGGLPKKSACFIELTLNHPRTPAFKTLVSSKQCKLYDKWYRIVLHTFGQESIVEHERTFEFCESGHVHLHAHIELKFDHKHFPVGVVADMVKTSLNQMPKKYSKYNDKAMYHFDNGYKYKSPSITCKYTSIDDKDRNKKWRDYIRKHINK